ncbi:N-acetylmuramoyl-L-alanine amidase family protein [Psychroserpens ponticola]|uniref:N-acetylmuramoyl-L-alanine amidase n=1 Tax=Psychroserpens ponticola TaxID=2932268 RepID=A0ABY7RVZ5_9FLAO|nr:N-acetylmuramoyl-L-alanine amidase [Psychroserpens ponticola]WCO00932.1 N-acetylmuramoyl-L-alanine amidase [Psychroserpens ponticola]
MKTNLQYIIVCVTLLFTCFLTSANNITKNEDKFVVVLDAGHGGHDSGNLGSGYKEKEIALKIVLAVGNELEKNEDIKVIYTRKNDKFVTLRGRAKIANDAGADLFVSVHCNAHNSSAHGTETFVLGLHADQRNFEIAKKENEVIFLEADYQKHYEGFDPNSPESMIGITIMQELYLEQSISLARLVEDSFKDKRKRNSRGVKQAGFWVLHNTYMPSVLIETGFLTYKKEGAYLNSKNGQTKMSSSIIEAILTYKKNLDQNIGENIYEETPSISNQETKNVELIYNNIIFKVQIAASSRDLEPQSYNFKGLSEISKVKVGGLFKYYYGSTSDLNEIRRLESLAKQKGYTSSFVVAFEDGKQIKLSEALKTRAN